MDFGISSVFNRYITKNSISNPALKWSRYDKSPSVTVSRDGSIAYFYVEPVLESTGTSGVRSNICFMTGEHSWDFCFVEPPLGTSVMVGVGTRYGPLHFDDYCYVDLIGYDMHSWGLSYRGTLWHNGVCKQFCPAFYSKYKTIKCSLNMLNGTISFQFEDGQLIEAFTGVYSVHGSPLYAMASSTAAGMEISIGHCHSKQYTLQELCMGVILRFCPKTMLEKLNLPNTLKRELWSRVAK